MSKHKFFETPHGSKIAYHYSAGSSPAVVFFGGLMSDMEGTKVTALEAHCRDRGQGFLRFDYSGHGQSSGNFDETNIGMWAQDAISLIEAVVEGSVVIIGSSMGGWTGLMACLALKPRVKAFIGIAAAPDFTERLMWGEFSQQQKQDLEEKGRVELPSDYDDEPYIISRQLIEDGRKHLLLNTPIELDIPVRLLHGERDTDVPCSTAHDISAMLTSDDVEVTLVKVGDHSLSSPHDLKRLMNVLDQLLGDLV